jgi:hypothetical protein
MRPKYQMARATVQVRTKMPTMTGLVNVEVLDGGPEPAAEVVFLAGEAKVSDGADEERAGSDLAKVRIGRESLVCRGPAVVSSGSGG